MLLRHGCQAALIPGSNRTYDAKRAAPQAFCRLRIRLASILNAIPYASSLNPRSPTVQGTQRIPYAAMTYNILVMQ